MPLAMTASPFGTYVFTDRPFDLDVQLFADVLADAMHRIAATGTASLVLRQVVFDWFTRQVRRQRLASDLASFRLAGRGQSGEGQRGLGILIVLVAVPANRICVTRRAVFGFHAAQSVDRYARVAAEPEASQIILERYPAPVRAWIERHGGLTSRLLLLRGRELTAMFRRCR